MNSMLKGFSKVASLACAGLWCCCASPIRKNQQAPSANPPASQGAASPTKLKGEIESFASLSGAWKCKGVFPANGKAIESQITFTPDLEGAWLLVRHDDLPPNRFHALELWGFDKDQKLFVAHIYDNFGGQRKLTSSGWDDKQLTWLLESPGTAGTQRFVFKRETPEQLMVNWEVKGANSDWQIGDTLTCNHISGATPKSS